MAGTDLSSQMKNNKPSNIEFDDLQTLLRFGNGHLVETEFMLLEVNNVNAASEWLSKLSIGNALASDSPPENLVQIAFTAEGLRSMGLKEDIIAQFSDEFIIGMSGDESRSRRLGDVGDNAPDRWAWGGKADQPLHILLLLYTIKGKMSEWRRKVQTKAFERAFKVISILPTAPLSRLEPFGFVDGISQPSIDWTQSQSTDLHHRDHYSNLLAPGEIVLGYPNEYGFYTNRPLIDPQHDSLAVELPVAEDQTELKDLGRNGCYLVLRQLQQDVPGFWQFIDRSSNHDSQQREQLAASMVGRHRDGTPLESRATRPIAGTDVTKQPVNHFTYALDPDGHRCPVGAHIRRSNPRTGDYPPGVSGFISRILRALGFAQQRPDDDLVSSTRFHRLLRRGRSYGPELTPEQAIKKDAQADERGLQFVCLVANISRQFEFVQNAWSVSSTFGSVHNERDPLISHREPLLNAAKTDRFNRPDATGPMQTTRDIPQFVTVRGGAYFFLPGLRALRYISAASTRKSDSP